jgi:hypothetical protein
VPSAGTKKAGFKKFGSWTSFFLPFESPASTYQVIATPLAPNQTGVRYFCSFADAVVRVGSAAIATCDYTQSPLQ